MTDVLKKVLARYQANATLYPAVPLYHARAKEGLAFPYAEFSTFSGAPVTHFFSASGDYVVDEIMLQFRIFHNDDAALADYQEALHTQFDKCSLTLTATGDTFLSCLRDIHFLKIDPMLSKDNDHVYYALSRYNLQWQNAL